MNYLGEIYDRDDTSKGEAIIWYARAAEGGDSRTQASLAGLLTSGNGLPAPQREAAARYWRLAANAGSRDAQFQLANLLQKGEVPFTPDPIATKPDGGAEEIFELYSTAFARGFPARRWTARLFKGFSGRRFRCHPEGSRTRRQPALENDGHGEAGRARQP